MRTIDRLAVPIAEDLPAAERRRLVDAHAARIAAMSPDVLRETRGPTRRTVGGVCQACFAAPGQSGLGLVCRPCSRERRGGRRCAACGERWRAPLRQPGRRCGRCMAARSKGASS